VTRTNLESFKLSMEIKKKIEEEKKEIKRGK
jgi:hypothetical protein